MSASILHAFLQGQRVKNFAAVVEPRHVFGVGVSWNKKTQKIDSVRLIIRDVSEGSTFKKFAKTPEEKSVEAFFASLPFNHEDPCQGLHGHVYALKISARGDFKQAFYRRLGNVPVAYEDGAWSKYLYEDLHEYAFRDVKIPEDTGKFFRLEVKCDFEGRPQGYNLYPKYRALADAGNGSMSVGLAQFFGSNVHKLFEGYDKIIEGVDSLTIDDSMLPVSVGETESSIKVYFVDFKKERLLLK